MFTSQTDEAATPVFDGKDNATGSGHGLDETTETDILETQSNDDSEDSVLDPLLELTGDDLNGQEDIRESAMVSGLSSDAVHSRQPHEELK